jgi:GTP-binding protein
MAHNPLIAIVGRPNVGKSTFFNRMLKSRKAIVDSQEGITRDRIYGTIDWAGYPLEFVDTGGYIPDDMDVLNAAVRKQAQAAIEEAEMILFMVDGRVPPTSSDLLLAQFVRESGKPHLLAVNKCDSRNQDDQCYLYYELGFETVLPISALNGRLTGDLLDVVIEKLKLGQKVFSDKDQKVLRLAIIGMPNVGKSSLTNALLKKEQTIVTPIAGTTRDSIDTTLRWYGKDIILVDTAGLRKKSKVEDNIEYYSNVRTYQAISRADVILVMLDANKGVMKQDKTIAQYVIQKGKGLVIVVNKWDLVTKNSSTLKEFQRKITHQFKALDYYPSLFISALTKQRVSKVLDFVWNVYQARQQKINTKDLNSWLEKVQRIKAPPAPKGKEIKIKFITQVNVSPPIFACFCNYPKLMPASYQRFIENQFRKSFNFEGVPLIFSFRKK